MGLEVEDLIGEKCDAVRDLIEAIDGHVHGTA